MKSQLPKGFKLKGDWELREEGHGAMSHCVGTVSNLDVTNNKLMLLASIHMGMEPADECTQFSENE